MAEKYQWFNGLKFTRDDKTGYYMNSTIHKRMHVYVWEYYNGKVEKNYEVHHIDFDRSNNNIENLQLLSRSDHRKLHAALLTSEQREWKRNNMNENARPKAVEWHKSAAGAEWHKRHFEEHYDDLHKLVEKSCVQCGKLYFGEVKSKFCSNACKSAYRRASGADLIEQVCPVCEQTFKTNKYRRATTCSRTCANIYRRMPK